MFLRAERMKFSLHAKTSFESLGRGSAPSARDPKRQDVDHWERRLCPALLFVSRILSSVFTSVYVEIHRARLFVRGSQARQPVGSAGRCKHFEHFKLTGQGGEVAPGAPRACVGLRT